MGDPAAMNSVISESNLPGCEMIKKLLFFNHHVGQEWIISRLLIRINQLFVKWFSELSFQLTITGIGQLRVGCVVSKMDLIR